MGWVLTINHILTAIATSIAIILGISKFKEKYKIPFSLEVDKVEIMWESKKENKIIISVFILLIIYNNSKRKKGFKKIELILINNKKSSSLYKLGEGIEVPEEGRITKSTEMNVILFKDKEEKTIEILLRDYDDNVYKSKFKIDFIFNKKTQKFGYFHHAKNPLHLKKLRKSQKEISLGEFDLG